MPQHAESSSAIPSLDRAPESSLPHLTAHECDCDRWEQEIARIVSLPNHILCNLNVTLAHFELSKLLQRVTGEDSGANFHTWAVWGSKKAGETIRLDDTRRIRQACLIIGTTCGLIVAASTAFHPSLLLRVSGVTAGAFLTILPYFLLLRSLNRTRQAILAGNCTVLEDIGNVTARFVAKFVGQPGPDEREIETFLESLRPGRTESGGQALLARAFLYYYQASHESNLDTKHEQMFLANCYAILHEHIRLTPFIRVAMPRFLSRLITSQLLRFQLGGEALQVGADVPPESTEFFPETLRDLNNPELIAFLQGMDGWDRTPNDLSDSHANDWANLNDRMSFIVDLFRTRHLSPGIFTPPFTKAQESDILAGRVPDGSL